MLPHAYGLPAAILLVLGGALSCFAGYRLFRVVLAIYGFILGAAAGSAIMGTGSTVGMIAAALLGGLAGSVIFVMAYFVGVALVGAGLGALLAHAVWTWIRPGEPPALVVVLVALAGAVGAMVLQRYVIIVATAFGGAWTVLVGVANILALRGVTHGASASEVWILYPTTTPDLPYALYIWVALGFVGLAVQLGITAGKARRK